MTIAREMREVWVVVPIVCPCRKRASKPAARKPMQPLWESIACRPSFQPFIRGVHMGTPVFLECSIDPLAYGIIHGDLAKLEQSDSNCSCRAYVDPGLDQALGPRVWIFPQARYYPPGFFGGRG